MSLPNDMSYQRIGRRIRQIRLMMKKTQVEFGELIGVSNITISYWECGRTTPSDDSLVKLRFVFGFDLVEGICS